MKRVILQKGNCVPNLRHRLAAVICSVALAFSWPILAIETTSDSDTLKAAFLINIARFVTWQEHNDQITLCINSESPVEKPLRQAVALVQGARSYEVMTFEEGTQQCHLLFHDRYTSSLPPALSNPRHPGTLYISDETKSLERGYDMELFLRNLKLNIAVNKASLHNRHFKISSKLLQISTLEDGMP